MEIRAIMERYHGNNKEQVELLEISDRLHKYEGDIRDGGGGNEM